MVTNLRLELDDDERARIALIVTGKKGLATRAQIAKYIDGLLKADRKPCGGSRVVTCICPKCRKPIGITVPKAAE